MLSEANACTDCIGVIAWMHTFSPAKMWIRGLKTLHKPLLHLHTQFGVELPWHSIDMDFMNLNQAAHGDREFGYIQSRLSTSRKTIAGHVSDPHTRGRIGSWVRAALGHAELSTLKVARFGDNMRGVAVTEGDKVEAEAHFGASIDTYGVNDLVDVVERVRPADVDKLVREYEHTYRVAAELLPGGDRHASLRHGAQIELGLRKFLQDGGFHAFTTNFEDLGGLRQLPGLAVQRLMADGYGFGGEGDWKTAMMLRTVKVMAEGLPGGTSFMEDYTYDLTAGPRAHPRCAHARGLPEHRGRDPDAGDPSAVDRRSRGSGPAAVHRSTRRRGHHRYLRHGCPIPAGGQRGPGGRADGGTAEPPGRLRGVGTAAVLVHLGGGVADGRCAAPHRADHGGRDRDDRRLRRDDGHRTARHRRRRPRCAASSTSCKWNDVYHHVAAGSVGRRDPMIAARLHGVGDLRVGDRTRSRRRRRPAGRCSR